MEMPINLQLIKISNIKNGREIQLVFIIFGSQYIHKQGYCYKIVWSFLHTEEYKMRPSYSEQNLLFIELSFI